MSEASATKKDSDNTLGSIANKIVRARLTFLSELVGTVNTAANKARDVHTEDSPNGIDGALRRAVDARSAAAKSLVDGLAGIRDKVADELPK